MRGRMLGRLATVTSLRWCLTRALPPLFVLLVNFGLQQASMLRSHFIFRGSSRLAFSSLVLRSEGVDATTLSFQRHERLGFHSSHLTSNSFVAPIPQRLMSHREAERVSACSSRQPRPRAVSAVGNQSSRKDAFSTPGRERYANLVTL